MSCASVWVCRGASVQLARLEQGRVKYPSISLIADYLQACGAGFEDLLDLLKAYTAQPPVLKQTCDAAGVPTITCPFCLCFGREL